MGLSDRSRGVLFCSDAAGTGLGEGEGVLVFHTRLKYFCIAKPCPGKIF